MRKENITRGSDVYVRDPQRFITDCTCIVGDVARIMKRSGIKWCELKAYVGRMGGGYYIDVAFRIEELGVRVGTPISKISTQPGTPGYGEWLRISQSWGR